MAANAADDDIFWGVIDRLVETSEIVVDRPKGSAHPRMVDMVYPLDYGYLAGTTASDGQGIDVWIGSQDGRQVTGIACTADAWKRDAEIKILFGCTAGEMALVKRFLDSHGLGCVVIRRPARDESEARQIGG